jgi:hypothetical protein
MKYLCLCIFSSSTSPPLHMNLLICTITFPFILIASFPSHSVLLVFFLHFIVLVLSMLLLASPSYLFTSHFSRVCVCVCCVVTRNV